MKALQSEALARAVSSEILTQHDDMEFMRESDRNRRVRRSYRQVPHSRLETGLSLTRNFARGSAGRSARDKFPRRKIQA